MTNQPELKYVRNLEVLFKGTEKIRKLGGYINDDSLFDPSIFTTSSKPDQIEVCKTIQKHMLPVVIEKLNDICEALYFSFNTVCGNNKNYGKDSAVWKRAAQVFSTAYNRISATNSKMFQQVMKYTLNQEEVASVLVDYEKQHISKLIFVSMIRVALEECNLESITDQSLPKDLDTKSFNSIRNKIDTSNDTKSNEVHVLPEVSSVNSSNQGVIDVTPTTVTTEQKGDEKKEEKQQVYIINGQSVNIDVDKNGVTSKEVINLDVKRKEISKEELDRRKSKGSTNSNTNKNKVGGNEMKTVPTEEMEFIELFTNQVMVKIDQAFGIKETLELKTILFDIFISNKDTLINAVADGKDKDIIGLQFDIICDMLSNTTAMKGLTEAYIQSKGIDSSKLSKVDNIIKVLGNITPILKANKQIILDIVFADNSSNMIQCMRDNYTDIIEALINKDIDKVMTLFASSIKSNPLIFGKLYKLVTPLMDIIDIIKPVFEQSAMLSDDQEDDIDIIGAVVPQEPKTKIEQAMANLKGMNKLNTSEPKARQIESVINNPETKKSAEDISIKFMNEVERESGLEEIEYRAKSPNSLSSRLRKAVTSMSEGLNLSKLAF